MVQEDFDEYREYHHAMKASGFAQEQMELQEEIAKKNMEHAEQSARITSERIEYLQDEQSAARKDIDEDLSEYLAQANRNVGPSTIGEVEQSRIAQQEVPVQAQASVRLRGGAALQGLANPSTAPTGILAPSHRKTFREEPLWHL